MIKKKEIELSTKHFQKFEKKIQIKNKSVVNKNLVTIAH